MKTTPPPAQPQPRAVSATWAGAREHRDPLAIDAIDHVELWVGNARQAAHFYQSALGFTPVAYCGPETGCRDSASYVLRQNRITLVLTSPLRITSPMNHALARHGDAVHAIALEVQDCAAFYEAAVARGAVSAEAPVEIVDGAGTVRRAAIQTYGDVLHPIIERGSYSGPFWPGYAPYGEIFPLTPKTEDLGLIVIDHIVGNVELGRMEHWVNFYERVLGFTEMLHFTDKDISTEYSALMSKVVRSGNGKIKFPINEPAQGRRKSQIDEYLEFNSGPGAQHIAMGTKDIIRTVTELRRRGVSFLGVPKTYYEEVPNRVGTIKEDLAVLAELGILVDRDDDGYLLQIFTRPVQDRPTLFFEIIQREGSLGFGVGNFKALFEAIEREQARRGNL